MISLAAIVFASEVFAAGAPPQVTVTSSPTGTQINTLPSSNPAGTSDTVAFPVQGVTGGVPLTVQSGSIVTGQASLVVGAVSANVVLGSAGPVVQVYNPGAAVVYVKLGVGSGITAASTDTPVAPGSYIILNTGGTSTYIAAIAPSGTPTLTITTGTGSPIGWGGGSSGGGSSAITTWAGGTLGAMANYGTSPGAILVPGVNAFITNTIPVTGTFWQATQPVSIASMPSTPVTGTFWQATQPISAASLPLPTGAATSALQPTVDAFAGTTSSGTTGHTVFGSSTTAAPTYTTGSNWPLSLTTVGNLRVDGSSVTQPVSGTVTANAGTNLNTSALALDTSVSGLSIAQAASLGSNKGPMAQGSVTTAAPTYTTGQINPLSLDTSGNLRVVGPAFAGTVTNDIVIRPSSNFTRPSDTTAYAANDLMANSTTAGSVVPLSWTVTLSNAGNFIVRRAQMLSTGKSITNAGFALYLYTVTPTIANGDNAAFSTTLANLFCVMPITLTDIGTDDASGFGIPNIGSDCNAVTAGGTKIIYGLLKVIQPYTPTSAEVETIILEIHQNS